MIANYLLYRGLKNGIKNYQNMDSPDTITSEGGQSSPLSSSNPYLNVPYRKSFWQNFMEKLGFRTNYDTYKESLALQAKETEFGLAEKVYNEQYDSPIAQVQRERAAGLNPDLNGGITGGESSPLRDDGNPAIAPEADDMQMLGQVGNTIMGLFTTAIGLGKDALSLSQMSEAVNSQRIGNAGSLMDFAFNAAVNFTPENYPEDFENWKNNASGLASEIYSPMFSKKQQKVFNNSLKAFFNSAPKSAKDWETWLNKSKNRQEWFNTTSSEFYNDSDEVMRIISDNLMKTIDKLKKGEYNLEERKQDLQNKSLDVQELDLANQEEYLNGIDPTLQAGVENATNTRNLTSNRIDFILNDAIDSILEDLKDKSESGKRGHGLAQAAILVFSLFRMMNFSMPSFSRSSSTSVGPDGTSTSVSSKFGF